MRSLFHGSTHLQSWNSLPSSFLNTSALICYKKTSYHEHLSSMHPCRSQAWWIRKLHRNNVSQSTSVHPHDRKGRSVRHLAWNIKQYNQKHVLFRNKTTCKQAWPHSIPTGCKILVVLPLSCELLYQTLIGCSNSILSFLQQCKHAEKI